MATEGNHSPLTFKALLYSAGSFLIAWSATKLLDTYFDTTLLQDAKGWLIRTWNWMLIDTPMPHWSLLMVVVVLVSTLSVAIYYYRTADGAYGELYEAEKAVHRMNNPEAPALSRSQIMVLNNLSTLVQHGLSTNSRFLGSGLGAATGLDSLELEITLGQLEEKGFVQYTSSVGTVTSTPMLCLTLKGKEYVLAHRKSKAKLAEQKAKEATPES